MTEIWKPVKDFEGYYEVSDLGRVRSVDRTIYDTVRNVERLLKGRILVQKDNGHGYKRVVFCKEHKLYNKYIHIMVAETFIPNPDNLPQVNHKDEDKSNNVVTNLEWCTAKYNSNYGTGIERHRLTMRVRKDLPMLFPKKVKVKKERKKLTPEERKEYQKVYYRTHKEQICERYRTYMKERGNELRRIRRRKERELRLSINTL